MSIREQLKAQAAQAVESGAATNLSEQREGGGGGERVALEGWVRARLVGVIEIGSHATKFKKEGADQVRLEFALVGGKGKDSEGVAHEVYNAEFPTIIKPWPVTLSNVASGQCAKLFNGLNWMKQDVGSFAEMLGTLVKVKLYIRKGNDGKLYTEIDLKAGFERPENDDLEIYKDPDVDDKFYRAFLWNAPTQAQWDSIYQKPYKDKDGNEKDNNRLQNEIQKALNYVGSPIQQMLEGTDGLPSLEYDAKADVMPDLDEGNDDNEPPFDTDPEEAPVAKPARKKIAATDIPVPTE